MKEAKPTFLSMYEFQLEALENKLTKILSSTILNDEQKEKLRTKYNKKIEEYKIKIQKEKMKSQ